MNRENYTTGLMFVLVFFTGIAITYIIDDAYGLFSDVPPKPYFSAIVMDGEMYEAERRGDILYMNSTGDIIFERQGPDNVEIKLAPFSCVGLQVVVGIDNDGNFVCAIP